MKVLAAFTAGMFVGGVAMMNHEMAWVMLTFIGILCASIMWWDYEQDPRP